MKMKSFKRIYILLLLVCCVFSCVCNAQNLSDSNEEKKNLSSDPLVTETFVGDDLKVVLNYLAEETKINIKYDNSIEGKVTGKFDKVPLSKVLEVILSATPYKIKKTDDNYLVYYKDASIVTNTYSGDVWGLTEHSVTYVFISDDLLVVLDTISSDTGVNIMYEANVNGVVNCKLEKVPLDKALEIILAATPFKAEKRDSYYVITEPVAGQKQFQISGNIGIAKVKVEGFLSDIYTDANGYYTASVDAGFSGKVKPVKEGYKFDPSFVIYNNLKTNREKQDYKAAKVSLDQAEQKELNEPVINETFVGDDILLVFDEITARIGINIMYDASIAGLVTCRLDRIPLSKALEIISSPTEYIVKKMDDYYIVTSPALDDIKNGVIQQKTAIKGNIEIPLESIVEFPLDIVSESDGSYRINIPTGFSGKILPRKEENNSSFTNQDDPVENTEFDEPNITNKYVNEDLRIALDILAKDTDINIIYTDFVEGNITCKLNDVPLSKALEIILAATPYRVKKMDGYILVYSKEYPIGKIASGKKIKDTTGPDVTDTFVNDDLLVVLNTISSSTGINIIYGDNVQGVVSCRLKNVPLGKALEMILAATPYTAKKRDNYYVVTEYLSSDKRYQISGSVGIANVKMDGLPGEIYTDVNGYYSANVEAGFSGKVQPVKEGYKFNPSYIVYNNLDSKRIKQDYKANKVLLNQNAQKELSDPLISKTLMDDELWEVLNTLAEETGINIILDNAIDGIVTCNLNKVPLSKALEIILSATPYIIKKMDGYYLVTSPELDDIKNRVTVDYGFSRIIKPVNKDYSFSPPVNQYPAVTQNLPIQSDNSQKQMLTISDRLEVNNMPFSGVNITANPGDIKTVTDNNGQYSIQVPYGWSGEITMTKPGIKFTPESKSFKNVTTDIKSGIPVLP
jgi:type II secretory pathway component HofQ